MTQALGADALGTAVVTHESDHAEIIAAVEALHHRDDLTEIQRAFVDAAQAHPLDHEDVTTAAHKLFATFGYYWESNMFGGNALA